MKTVKSFLQSEDGPTAVEYAVMLALIVVTCLIAIRSVGNAANGKFAIISDTVTIETFPVGSSSPGYRDVPSTGTWELNLAGGTRVTYDASTGEEVIYWGGGGTQTTQGTPGYLGSDRGQLWTRTD